MAKISLMAMRLMAIKLDTMRLQNKKIIKKYLGPKKRLSLKKIRSLDFFTFEARQRFTKLRQAFIKALIFYFFDLECHI